MRYEKRTDQDSPSTVRRRLGAFIKQRRSDLGYTQKELAERIGCLQGKIHKIETGRQSIVFKDIGKLIEELEVTGDAAESFRDDAQWAAKMGRNDDLSGRPSWFTEFLKLEEDATHIRSWTNDRVPGSLQSEAYMTSMFKPQGSDMEQYVAVRKQRKNIFSRPDPPKCEFIVNQSFFTRLEQSFGWIARDQVDEFIRVLDTYKQVSLLVLPYRTKPIYVPEDFTILALPDENGHDVVWVENLHGGRTLSKPDDVQGYHERWNELLDAAMGRNDSRRVLDNLLAELGDRA